MSSKADKAKYAKMKRQTCLQKKLKLFLLFNSWRKKDSFIFGLQTLGGVLSSEGVFCLLRISLGTAPSKSSDSSLGINSRNLLSGLKNDNKINIHQPSLSTNNNNFSSLGTITIIHIRYLNKVKRKKLELVFNQDNYQKLNFKWVVQHEEILIQTGAKINFCNMEYTVLGKVFLR